MYFRIAIYNVKKSYMDEKNTLESLLRKFLCPIINEAVDKAIARHLSPPMAPHQDLPELIGVKMTAEMLHLSVPTILRVGSYSIYTIL